MTPPAISSTRSVVAAAVAVPSVIENVLVFRLILYSLIVLAP
jgi:hypothetical protein